MLCLVVVCSLVGECPSGSLAIALIPPSVAHREVEQSVHLGLLARCSRSLERTCGRIEPDVNTGDQSLGDNHVVVLEENDLAQELWHARNLDDAANQVLTCAIGRMGLAGIDELDGELLVVDNLGQAVQVVEQQIGALVSSKAAGKADEQCVGVDLVDNRHDASGVALLLEPIGGEVALDKVDELVLELHAQVPDGLVRHAVDGSPGGQLVLMVEIVSPEGLCIELLPLAGGPGGHVHTVGDIAHV